MGFALKEPQTVQEKKELLLESIRFHEQQIALLERELREIANSK